VTYALRFRDRTEAGRLLGQELDEYGRRDDVIVLALPRGGVPVGFEIARRLSVPLDVFIVRKLGVPWHPELAMGAIASGGVQVLNDDVVRAYGIPSYAIREVAEHEQRELERRARDYRGDRPFPDLRGRTVILVDDGLATGSTMRAAVAAVRKQNPATVVVAVPVAAAETCELLRGEADRVVCLRKPEPFSAVGLWYHDFSQTTDEEVRSLLAAASPLDSATTGHAPRRS
jgi:putative phosphoribosyl transferase